MQRYFSDTALQSRGQQHAPQRPSRLNPAQAGRRGTAPPAGVNVRGTVSMPTSPLKRAIELPWAQPQTAQPFFGFSNSDGDMQMDIDPFLPASQPSPSTSHLTQASITPQPDPFHLTTSSFDFATGPGDIFDPPSAISHEHDVDMLSLTTTPSGSEGRMRQQQAWPSGHSASPASAKSKRERDEHGFPNGDAAAFFGFAVAEEHDEGTEGDMENDEHSTRAQAERRKKRQQVRVACTHCQKACKKCSNTRPCDRCTKYGLSDCVDSTRKPRKTGVKRGPYRRRNSKAYAAGHSTPPASSFGASNNAESSSSPYWQHNLELLRDMRTADGQGYSDRAPALGPSHLGYHSSDQASIQRQSKADPHEALYAQQQQQVHQLRQIQLQQQRDLQLRQRWLQQQQQRDQPSHQQHQFHDSRQAYPAWPRPEPREQPPPTYSFPPQPPSPTLPAPRPSKLENALSAALSGLAAQPRWVDGQRVHEGPGTLMPQTPTVPFPLSLQKPGRGADPFSRAVSPIRDFRFGPGGGGVPDALPEIGSVEKGQNAELYLPAGGAIDLPQYSSAAVPVQANGGPQLHVQGYLSPPDHNHNQPQGQQAATDNSWAPWSSSQPTTIALKRIRKPSLRTLIIEGISRESSPVASPAPGPLSGSWSPGLALMSQSQGAGGTTHMDGGGRDGTMSPTLYQGELDGAEEIDWGFGTG